MFGFFNKWKRAGRGVGVTGGAGKLCVFDKDGNVVSSGIAADDVGKIYQHTVTLMTDSIVSDAPEAVVTYVIYNRSSTPLTTWAKLRDATPTYPTLCSGSFYYTPATARFPAVHVYRQGTGSNARITAETYLGTGQTMPAFFDLDTGNTYTPTDHVKEI